MNQVTDVTSVTQSQSTLCEALDRVLDRGAVVSGRIVVSVAGIDLLMLELNVLLSSIERAIEAGAYPGPQ